MDSQPKVLRIKLIVYDSEIELLIQLLEYVYLRITSFLHQLSKCANSNRILFVYAGAR